MKQQFLTLCLVAGANLVTQGQASTPPAAPCAYHYPAAHHPACVGGHTDQLLPIVYGRPTPQAVRQAQRGRVVLRGCLVSGCDPRYYCPLHKKDL